MGLHESASLDLVVLCLLELVSKWSRGTVSLDGMKTVVQLSTHILLDID